MEVIINFETDLLLRKNHINAYGQVKLNRINRKKEALENYLSANFSNKPMQSLGELQKQLQLFQKILTTNQEKTEAEINQISLAIESIQNKIYNNEYYTEGSPEHQYRLDYNNAVTNFVWPNEAELEIQKTENDELLSLLNAN